MIVVTDIIRNFLNGIDLTLTVESYSNDGTDTTIIVENAYHARAKAYIEINSIDYLIKSVSGTSIVVNAVIDPVNTVVLSTPFYFDGTEKIYKGRTFIWDTFSSQKVEGEDYFLYNTGTWFDSFALVVAAEMFEITAMPTRGDTNMIEEYGNVLGLDKESLTEVGDFLLPLILEDYTKKLMAA